MNKKNPGTMQLAKVCPVSRLVPRAEIEKRRDFSRTEECLGDAGVDGYKHVSIVGAFRQSAIGGMGGMACYIKNKNKVSAYAYKGS